MSAWNNVSSWLAGLSGRRKHVSVFSINTQVPLAHANALWLIVLAIASFSLAGISRGTVGTRLIRLSCTGSPLIKRSLATRLSSRTGHRKADRGISTGFSWRKVPRITSFLTGSKFTLSNTVLLLLKYYIITIANFNQELLVVLSSSFSRVWRRAIALLDDKSRYNYMVLIPVFRSLFKA